jgi:hypothetical protein
MGVEAPTSVAAVGFRYAVNDGGEMPDVLQVTYEYPGFTLSYEACNLNGHGLGGRTTGMAYYNAQDKKDLPNEEVFYGTNGALFADRIGFEIYPELKPFPLQDSDRTGTYITSRYRMERRQVAAFDATAVHVRNFIECVKSRQKLQWDPATQDFRGCPEASQLLGRTARKPWNLL